MLVDKRGTPFKENDMVQMKIEGLGIGIVSIINKDNELHIYDETQGYYPLKEAVNRKDMYLLIIHPMRDENT